MKNFGLHVTIILLLFQGCRKTQNDANTNAPEAGLVIQVTVQNVILPKLQQLAEASTNLEYTIALFNNTGSEEALKRAQQAWLDTRIIWEQYEAALYGPVTTLSIDPALDSWPVNFIEIDSILATSKPLTANYIDSLPETLRGFHCIEYILFGTGKSRLAPQISPRMKDLARAVSENLKAKTHRLINEWSPALYNYADQFIKAGSGSQVYNSKQAALLEIAEGLSGIADEVANGKIQEPFATLDSMLEESPFALNSWTDFKNNIIGIQQIYGGNGSAGSLSEWVQHYNKSLDIRIKNQLSLIIQSFESFKEPFGRSIHVSPGAVTSVQSQLNQLKEIIDKELIPLIRLQVTQ